MDIASISVAITGIRKALELARNVVNLSKDVAVNEKAQELLQVVISLQSDMLSLQSEHYELLDTKRKLEERLGELESWKETENDYELLHLMSGSVVRIRKGPDGSSSSKEWYCANCFENKKKSLLQRKDFGRYPSFCCPACQAVVVLDSSDEALRRLP